MSGPWIVVVAVLWAVVVLLGVVVLGLLRRVNDVLVAVEVRLQQPVPSASNGLPVGARVPVFEAVAESGGLVSWDWFGVGAGVYVLVRLGCAGCDVLVGELVGLSDPLGGVRLVVVGEDTAEQRHRLAGVDAMRMYQRGREVSDAFACTGVPYAFAVDDQGVVVAAGAANRVLQLRGLAAALASAVQRSAVPGVAPVNGLSM